MPPNNHKIFIISGPSRVGKDAITKELLKKRDLNLEKIITATSRPRRQGEIDGKHYYFFTPEEFDQKIQEGFFLEWAVLSGGRYYGTPVDEFDRIQAKNKNVVMNIDVQGAVQLAKLRDDLVRIFIKPDSIKNIKRRMEEAGFTQRQKQARLLDLEREMSQADKYDYSVVNREGKLNDTVEQVAKIIKREIQT